jgi:hypothetical protein
LSEVFRERYHGPGHVYIAGSLADCVIKIGTTTNISRQQSYLRNRKYGRIDDWVLLYHVWVDERGRVEHAALRRLRRYQTLRMYEKDGSRQKGREIVRCSFSTALEALSYYVGDDERSSAWQSSKCADYEFDRQGIPSNASGNLAREPESQSAENASYEPLFFKKIAELELSIRSSNCLKNDNIVYLGDLLLKTEAEMLRTPNFGRKSLNEIREVVANMGLRLGTDIPGWPPRNVETLAKCIGTPLFTKVAGLKLSIRSANCLKNENIIYLCDLVEKTEAELLCTPNFGRKSLNEIKEVLAQMGMRLGMQLPDRDT